MFIAVVPAAGRGERFGGQKLAADVEGQPVLDRTLRSAIDASATRVVVVLASAAGLERVKLLDHPTVSVVLNLNPGIGMFSSIQAGLKEAEGERVVVVLPGDMPYVQSTTIRRVADEAAKLHRAVVATFDGKRGHPLAFPSSLRPKLLAHDTRSNLKDALLAINQEPVELPVEDEGVLRDVDYPADIR